MDLFHGVKGEDAEMLQKRSWLTQARGRLPLGLVNLYRGGMAFEVFSKNGQILPMSEATVPLSNIEYTYGFGVYESIRVVRGKPLFLHDHVERLMMSARVIELAHTLDAKTVETWTRALVEKVTTDACNLKMLLIGAKKPEDVRLFIVPLSPLFPDKKLYTRGATTITVPYERYLPNAKTLNMLPSYLAYRKAKNAGCYDALLINRHGCITEGTRTNFFAIKGKTLISPPKEEILEGVTLMHVLEAAKKNGYDVEYRPIPLKDIATFDGAFLTSTSSKIMPLSMIDTQVLTIPPALSELIKHFDAFLLES
jgi:branched-subunit amino acid aminotransferase/4-amino-4-deoxychorismate lyase